MPSKHLTLAPTAFELRKKIVDPVAAREIFKRDFAMAAFNAGAPGRKGSDVEAEMTVAAAYLVDAQGHGELASACMAFMLSIESAHQRPEDTAYLNLVRQIRDAAKSITLAADELTDQAARHGRETGYYEQMRGRALHHMAQALHERWIPFVSEPDFILQTIPGPIDNAFAGGQWSHGLSCSALYDEADAILKNHEQITTEIRQSGLSAMAKGKRADHERDAFIRELAMIYQHILGSKPAAREDGDGHPSPFMRFVARVYGEFGSVYDIDRNRYVQPSSGTVRSILEQMKA
ncbi:hypothetical protein [Novosphingobium sp. KA1]|uniref:hypothetical protein n=1 Tax=Novosphingobium sp. (strain KA1) TaxID=164608 RepID=UPI001A8DB3AE|nr:hypothetical protein [Novosphingobium sp. KA1]QSR17433.1 hypothetical protein CA833_09595 [Novosphingobium sp. KA1]